jgi:hypothetical protein
MGQGGYHQDELGFGRITDSPEAAVELIVRSLPPAVRKRLEPAGERQD